MSVEIPQNTEYPWNELHHIHRSIERVDTMMKSPYLSDLDRKALESLRDTFTQSKIAIEKEW